MAAIFSPLRSEYKMWDGYTLPTLKVIYRQKQTVEHTTFLSYDTGLTTSVMVKERAVFPVGEFLVLKSRSHVVEIQIETEPCSRSSECVCLCGVTFRNGNEIYTLNMCRGVSREGFIDVGQNEDGKLDYECNYNRFAVNYHNYRSSWFGLPGIRRDSYKYHDDTEIYLLNGFSCMITRQYETSSLKLVIINKQTLERLDELDGIASF
ncbi:hypothetical protein DPMN_153690 [Dreissena polymorpha]|uniref:Uncharacterized protein n=1 Tax=Dreissena polymorpha TaxID=45954 RepID=A0A9D4FJT1_DREPO|nr:hypothetical protein DPMN_153690 [Dreissena polymorpha]